MSMDTNLKLAFEAVAGVIKGRQPTLVSGTNLKTINGINLLGSGDIPLSSYGDTVSSTLVYFSNSATRGFTVNSMGSFKEGMRVRVIDQSDTSRWMEGQLWRVLSDTYCLVTVDKSTDVSGSSNSWRMAIAGEPGYSGGVAISPVEPSVALGAQVLWIETKEDGNVSMWLKTGD